MSRHRALASSIAAGLLLATAPGARSDEPGGGARRGSVDPAPARFRILQGGRWGFIDAGGRVAIAPRFERADDFSEGLAAVREGKVAGYVGPDGTMALVPEQAPAAALVHRPFRSGRAVVRVGRRLGAIDRAGKLAVPARFDKMDDYSEGLALACDAQGCGWIDVDGQVVMGPAGMGGTAVKGGVAAGWMVMGMEDKRAVLFRVGRAPLREEYQDTGLLSEGLVAVKIDGLWGYANADGDAVIPLRFLWAGEFSGGLAPAREDRVLCGYVGRNGAWIIPPRFRECGPFSEGRARVDLAASENAASRVAFVDPTGKPVIVGADAEPSFDSAGDFASGLAPVAQGGPIVTVGPDAPTGPRLGYVDRNGRYVWKPTR